MPSYAFLKNVPFELEKYILITHSVNESKVDTERKG
jgi:hypothetical protein